MNRKLFGLVLWMAVALSAPASANTLEAWSGVIGGNNTCPSGVSVSSPLAYGLFALAGNLQAGSSGNGIGDCGLFGGISDVSGATGPVMSAYNLPATQYPLSDGTDAGGSAITYSGASAAIANYGVLKAETNGTLTGDPYGGYAESNAFAIADDNITINGGTGNGSVTFVFGINGLLNSGDPATGEAQANVAVRFGSTLASSFFVAGTDASGNTVQGQSSYTGFDFGPGMIQSDGEVNFSITVPFTFGVSTELEIGLATDAYPNNGAASANFYDTAQLAGIQVADSSGNAVTGFTITSDSGTIYGADGVESAPEPGTFALLTGALLVGLSCAGRRARKAV